MSARSFENRDSDKTSYDVIIIGSGPSGLAAAAAINKFGPRKDILILEQHSQSVFAGTCHSFPIDKSEYQACSGLHYFGHSEATAAACHFMTNGLKSTRADGDTVYDNMYMLLPDASSGAVKETRVSLTSNNFEATTGLRKADLDTLGNNIFYVVAAKLLWWPFARLLWFYWWLSGGLAESARNYKEWCVAHCNGGKPTPVQEELFFIEHGDHGRHADRADTCALVGSLTIGHYMHGEKFFEGGMPEFARRCIQTVTKLGGTLLGDAPVTAINLDKSGKVRGVSCRGVDFAAPVVICSAGAAAAVKLLGPAAPAALKKTLDFGSSPTHGTVFLAFAGQGKTHKDLGLPSGPVWLHNRYFISHKPHTGRGGGVVVYILWEWCAFADEDCPARDNDYLDKKDKYTEAAKKYVFNVFPKLADFDFEDASTPATTLCWLAQSPSWGLRHVTERFLNYDNVRALKFENDDVPGLYLSGMDTVFAGIPGAMITGILTAQTIVAPGILNLFTNNFMSKIEAEYKKHIVEGDDSKTK